jgi:hypothetical protein
MVWQHEARDTLAKHVLYHYSQASSPFCSGYFGDGGLTNYLPEVGLQP